MRATEVPPWWKAGPRVATQPHELNLTPDSGTARTDVTSALGRLLAIWVALQKEFQKILGLSKRDGR